MAHIIVPDAEALLDRELPVLDHGFVRLVDYYGGDLRIVQAARISYAKEAKNDDTDGNRKLVDYLVRHRELSPLEQVSLTFHLKLPILVERQVATYRTARRNGVSGRYSVLPDEAFSPPREGMRLQDQKNRQGSDGVLDETLAEHLLTEEDFLYEEAFRLYHEHLDDGVSRELARRVLPLATYTQIYWQMDLRNLFHFLDERLDGKAQAEIRVYAEQMAVCAQAVAPMAFAAWEEHALNAVTFSRSECAALQAMIEGKSIQGQGVKGSEFVAKLAKVRQARTPDAAV